MLALYPPPQKHATTTTTTTRDAIAPPQAWKTQRTWRALRDLLLTSRSVFGVSRVSGRYVLLSTPGTTIISHTSRAGAHRRLVGQHVAIERCAPFNGAQKTRVRSISATHAQTHTQTHTPTRTVNFKLSVICSENQRTWLAAYVPRVCVCVSWKIIRFVSCARVCEEMYTRKARTGDIGRNARVKFACRTNICDGIFITHTRAWRGLNTVRANWSASV